MGRRIKRFVKPDWEMVAPNVMLTGLREKFGQDYVLLRELFRTEGHVLVEASPYVYSP